MRGDFFKLRRPQTETFWFKNKTAENLPDEQWLPVPGLEETHEVSNYGRFRCLDKMIYPRNGKRPYLRKGHLMSPVVRLVPNFYVGDYTYQVCINVEVLDSTFSFSIRRLVYHCFVEPIELHDSFSPKYSIIAKNGNGFDTRHTNLKKVTRSEIELLIYERDRIPNTLLHLSKEKRRAMAQKGAVSKYKPVSQYDKNGNKVAVYPSLVEASKKTGILLSSIGNSIQQRIKTAGGFVWKHGNGPEQIALGDYLTAKMDAYLSRVTHPIAQFDLDGNKVGEYPSIRDAVRKTKVKRATLMACLNGRLKTAIGFKWERMPK